MRSEFTLPAGTTEAYAHPAIADGRLYVRRGAALMCFGLSTGTRRPVGGPARSRVVLPDWSPEGTTVVKLVPPGGVAAPFCRRPPVVDGKLDDACWDTCPPAALRHPGRAVGDSPVTEFRLCRDSEHLYIGYRRDAAMQNGKPVPLRAAATTDAAPGWKDDSIEVAIADTRRTNSVLYGLSCTGTAYGGRRRIDRRRWQAYDLAWERGLEFERAVAATDTAWTAEIRVSLRTLAATQIDISSLTVNLLSRNRSGVGLEERMLVAPGWKGFRRGEGFMPIVERKERHRRNQVTLRAVLGAPREAASLQVLGRQIPLPVHGTHPEGTPAPRIGELEGVSIPADGELRLQVTPASASGAVRALELRF